MDNIGAEVGQKMRSAIKAKLMELGCYVDDELPDYVMVMVANKRSKIQMNEDLQLFLTTKTEAFVEWLQIVLKKLKEVTVTNPDIYKRSFVQESLKRKASSLPDIMIKKEKKDKSLSRRIKHNSIESTVKDAAPPLKSLTDDLPMKATNLTERRIQSNRTVVLNKKNQTLNESNNKISKSVDSFDIPTLSEVKNLDENNLVIMQKRIENARKRVVMMNSDSEDEDFINIKAENDDLFGPDNTSLRDTADQSKSVQIIGEEINDETPRKSVKTRKIKLVRGTSAEESNSKQSELTSNSKHSMLSYPLKSNVEPPNELSPKKSILDRLGKRGNKTADRMVHVTPSEKDTLKRTKISLTEVLREEREMLGISSSVTKGKESFETSHKEREKSTEKPPKERVSVLKRLGVRSKIAKPNKQIIKENLMEEVQERDAKPKSVASMVKVKPRSVIVPVERQANKNLLLKAVAEAQKSIVQTNINESHKKKQLMTEGLQTRKYKEKLSKLKSSTNKIKPTKLSAMSNKRLASVEISKLKKIVIEIASNDEKQKDNNGEGENSLEYIPKPVVEEISSADEQTYVPSTIDLSFDEFGSFVEEESSSFNASEETSNKQQRFIVTLDGFTDNKTAKNPETAAVQENSEEYNFYNRRSPIIFENDFNESNEPQVKTRNLNVPSVLPKVHPLALLKTKERCKYYPGCRLGDKCEYVHPFSPCKMFPQCKFGDKCLYIHPVCKFDASCTRRDCPYSHATNKTPTTVTRTPAAPSSQSLQVCKYYPNCSNLHCNYYHPRPCRFGKFCTKEDCNFTHEHKVKGNLTWQRT